MSATPEQTSTPDPPLLFVGRQDTSRLLEVYVKRSLSLNDGSFSTKKHGGKHRKWVPLEEKDKRDRRHSSDTSVHLAVDLADLEDGPFQPISVNSLPPREPQTDEKSSDQKKSMLKKKWMSFREKSRRSSKPSSTATAVKPKEPEAAASHLESSTQKPKDGKPKRKKDKKPSLWKAIIGFFTRDDSDSDERDPSPARPVCPLQPVEAVTPPATCLPIPKSFPEGEEVHLRRRKSTKKRHSKRLSLKLGIERPTSLVVEGVERVAPTDSYYENVSDELKKIVTEVKDSPTEEHVVFPQSVPSADTDFQPDISTEEVTERLIALIKQQGDFLDAKLKESPSLSNFFQGITYGSFQQLADQYMQSEIPSQPAQDPVVAPELVKLAFTLDFTARLASLSRQGPSHIMGLGNRYLEDRFTYLTEAQPASLSAELSQGEVHSTT